jgi:hypothetical protein
MLRKGTGACGATEGAGLLVLHPKCLDANVRCCTWLMLHILCSTYCASTPSVSSVSLIIFIIKEAQTLCASFIITQSLSCPINASQPLLDHQGGGFFYIARTHSTTLQRGLVLQPFKYVETSGNLQVSSRLKALSTMVLPRYVITPVLRYHVTPKGLMRLLEHQGGGWIHFSLIIKGPTLGAGPALGFRV